MHCVHAILDINWKNLVFSSVMFPAIKLYTASSNGIIFPQQVGGNLELSSLTSAEGVVLPIRVNGDLNLNRLTTANGLVLPQYIGGRLIAFDLRTIEGLKLPYGFDLKKFYYILRANGEIMNNPDKYYMKPPTEDDKKEIKR